MTDSLATLVDLTGRIELIAGLVAGGAGLALLYLIKARRVSSGWWGLVLSTATIAAVLAADAGRPEVLVGVILLATGGWLQEKGEATWGWMVIVAGAVAVGWLAAPDWWWILFAAPAVTVLAGLSLERWKRLPPHLLGMMTAITAFGIWVTVPDTEMARALLGAALPLSLATLPAIGARISPAGAYALAGVVVWVVADGGRGRGASVVGGWAALGAIPLVGFLTQRAAVAMVRRPWWVIGLHAVLVAVATRVIGFWESPGLAVLAVAVIATIAYLAFSALAGDVDDDKGAADPTRERSSRVPIDTSGD